MNFNQYQEAALKMAVYPNKGKNLLYPALGLAGETGEVVDKIKKYWRDSNCTEGSQLNWYQQDELTKEIGDSLWYLAALAYELGTTLEAIAAQNIDKLQDRVKRGVVHGEGDNR